VTIGRERLRELMEISRDYPETRAAIGELLRECGPIVTYVSRRKRIGALRGMEARAARKLVADGEL
jgi:hypothetical protein